MTVLAYRKDLIVRINEEINTFGKMVFITHKISGLILWIDYLTLKQGACLTYRDDAYCTYCIIQTVDGWLVLPVHVFLCLRKSISP